MPEIGFIEGTEIHDPQKAKEKTPPLRKELSLCAFPGASSNLRSIMTHDRYATCISTMHGYVTMESLKALVTSSNSE